MLALQHLQVELLTALSALKTALTVLWGFLWPTTYEDKKKKKIRANTKIAGPSSAFFGQSVTFDLTFLKPAKWSMVWTILPAFMPVAVEAGQRYTYWIIQTTSKKNDKHKTYRINAGSISSFITHLRQVKQNT